MTDRTKTICPPIFDLGGIQTQAQYQILYPYRHYRHMNVGKNKLFSQRCVSNFYRQLTDQELRNSNILTLSSLNEWIFFIYTKATRFPVHFLCFNVKKQTFKSDNYKKKIFVSNNYKYMYQNESNCSKSPNYKLKRINRIIIF